MRACKVRRNAPERRPVTKFATKRDRQVLQSPRACGPEKTLQAQGFTEGVILRGRRDVSPRQDAMKEVCSLRRGWAGGSASLSSPARNIVECDSARLDGPLFSGRLIRIPPSAVSGSPAPLRVARSPVVFLVATLRWPPAAALPVWTFCGAQYLGKTATLVPSRWSFARRHMLDTLADWRGLQRHCGGIGGRGLFAPQLTYPRSSWEQGSHLPYTPTGRLR